MEKDILITQISEWHKNRRHDKICEAILALSESERTDELICLLAQALNNKENYREALEALDNIRNSYSDNPHYCIRRAFALFQLHREHEALPWFLRAQSLGLEDIDETPGTYLPKSVSKWVERAEIWAPRRIEKNTFEAQCRAQREKKPQDNDLTDIDFEGLWDDCDYSLKEYVGSIVNDEDIAEIETELGYRLPASYKALIKQHNGGILARSYFENPLQRNWESSMFSVESIYGVDRKKSYSLCGDRGSKFWIEHWSYHDIGVAICDTITGGHDMIFLDYSDCGKDGEPCVVNINQENDYEITYLADNFSSFVRGLVPYEDEE